jgi:hypothetical protein
VNKWIINNNKIILIKIRIQTKLFILTQNLCLIKKKNLRLLPKKILRPNKNSNYLHRPRIFKIKIKILLDNIIFFLEDNLEKVNKKVSNNLQKIKKISSNKYSLPQNINLTKIFLLLMNIHKMNNPLTLMEIILLWV